jgi:hypothetical protein
LYLPFFKYFDVLFNKKPPAKIDRGFLF